MRMKVCILLLFVSSCLARTSPERGRKMPFQSPMEIKTIVLACDQDKDGELNSKELEECHHDNRQLLDINGDGRVERHEVKQNVRMASPDASSNRESYLYEIGKFKDLVRDCNQNNENDHLITVAEGIECLSKFPQHKSIFEEADQNKDGQLDRDELRDEVTRIRERMGVMPPKHHGGRGPTTPMN